MTIAQILGIGTANPPIRLTQEQSFYATGYQSKRIRKIVLNSDIEYRHFFFGDTAHLDETSDQQNERYLSGAVKTGCRAIMNCLGAADASVNDIEFLAVCSCTGYVCPDLGRRLIAHMRFKRNVQRVPSSVLAVRVRFRHYHACASLFAPSAPDHLRSLASFGASLF